MAWNIDLETIFLISIYQPFNAWLSSSKTVLANFSVSITVFKNPEKNTDYI